MRSHEERFAETKRRIAARQRREQRRRSTITTISAAATCLVLIVGVSFAMPGMVAGIRPGDFAGFETAASMYGGFMMLKMIVEFEDGQDPKAVMKDVLANCKKVEDDCEIYL